MANPVDIRPDHLEIVQGILREYLPEGVKVWVFGSRANWTTKDSSDLDLALEGENALSHKLLGVLKDAFDDSTLPYTVDVVDLNRIRGSFRQIVESQRVLLALDGDGTGRLAKKAAADAWRKVSLGDIAEIFDGPHATPKKTSDGPVFLGISNLSNGRIDRSATEHLSEDDYVTWTRRVAPRMGDIVFSYETRLGEAAAIPQDLRCCLGRRMGLLRPHTNRVDPRFLLYAYLGPGFQETLRSRAVQGSTVDRILITELGSFPIDIPTDLAEQQAIAHILGTLDDKIELNRRMNETLEEMARAMFKSWFVDFDPVRAKMEGRWRPGESLPGLPAHLYDLFPDRLVDSELGEIPEGWEVSTIEDIAERVAMGPFGSSILVATFVDAGVPVISGQHLNGILLEDNHYRFITQDHAQKLAKANVKRGDVIFTHAGSIGQVSYIPETSQFERYVISQRQFYLRCNKSRVSPRFIVHFFKTPNGQHTLLANTSSTGVPSIARPVTYLRSIKFCLPLEPIWREYDRIVGTTHSIIARNVAESHSLAAQRDVLLPRLIFGSVRIEDLK